MRRRFTALPLVFPAHAGMSLQATNMSETSQRFPRSRGDEPEFLEVVYALDLFSPLTRG